LDWDPTSASKSHAETHLDLPHRHAAGIQAQDLVIEAIEPDLPLAISCGLKLLARSRGTVISISPSSVRIDFELVPLRLLPEPWAAYDETVCPSLH
jgi:hypothetical protein